MLIRLVLVLCVYIMSAAGYAGNGAHVVGNGGDVIYCNESDGSVSKELFDYYEWSKLSSFEVDLPSEGDYLSLVNILIERLRFYNDDFADLLLKNLDSFLSEHVMVDSELTDILDTNSPIVIPISKCKLYQAINQRRPRRLGSPRFLVNKKVWNAIDDKNRAGLVLHEIIYKVLIDNTADLGQVDSAAVRELVWIAASNKVASSFSLDSFYIFIIEELKFPCYGRSFIDGRARFKCDGKVPWRKTNLADFLVGKTLESVAYIEHGRGHRVYDLPIVSRMFFIEKDRVVMSTECLWNDYYSHFENMSVNISSQILIKDKKLHYFSRDKSSVRNLNRTCSVSIEPRIENIEILSPDMDMFGIGDNVWYLKEDI